MTPLLRAAGFALALFAGCNGKTASETGTRGDQSTGGSGGFVSAGGASVANGGGSGLAGAGAAGRTLLGGSAGSMDAGAGTSGTTGVGNSGTAGAVAIGGAGPFGGMSPGGTSVEGGAGGALPPCALPWPPSEYPLTYYTTGCLGSACGAGTICCAFVCIPGKCVKGDPELNQQCVGSAGCLSPDACPPGGQVVAPDGGPPDGG